MSENLLDRIELGYRGELGESIKNKVRKRVSWICKNVEGSDILDVGCSQGTISILLGKEGKNVVGVDIIPEQIAYANNMLSVEREKNDLNVEFICEDFLQMNFDTKKFDTIIMGEILEHLFYPSIFLDKAKDILNENGKLIITVPFGINLFPDHKHTYYFLELFELINERIPVKTVCFMDEWIGFIADKQLQKSDISLNSDFIALLEDAFFKVDKKNNDFIELLKGKIAGLENESAEQESRACFAKEEQDRLEESLEIIKKEFEESIKINAEQLYKIKLNKQENEYLSDKIDELKKEILVIQKELKNSQNEKNMLNKKISKINQRNLELTSEKENAKELHKIIEQLKSSLKSIEVSYNDIQNEKNKLEEKLELRNKEQKATLRHIRKIREDNKLKNKKIVKLCQEIDGLERSIEAIKEHIDTLKESNDNTTAKLEECQELIKSLENENNQLKETNIGLNKNVKEKEELISKNAQLNSRIELLDKALKAEEEKSKELNDSLYKSQKLNKAYERLISVKLYNFLRKIKRKIKNLLLNKAKNEYPTVTVIIPTYKENAWIEQSIESALDQDYPTDKLDIIVSINGGDKEYFKILHRKYRNDKRIKIIFDTRKGAAIGRNNGIQKAKGEFIYFLDDDDYMTSGLISELVSHTHKNVDVVCGKINDLKDNGTVIENTYINKVIEQAGEGFQDNYHKYASLFVTICGKLYRTALVKDKFSPVNENFNHTEDVVFWAENAFKMSNPFYIVNSKCKNAYIRRLSEESLSRPKKANYFDFYVKDRIKIIEFVEKFIFMEEIPMMHKRFVYVLAQAQENHMLSAYNNFLDEKEKNYAKELIKNSKSLCLNKGRFSSSKGIAFCHNFAPFIDASAFVATKRLSEMSLLAEELIGWDVISADMTAIRAKDIYFDMFFAKSQYENRTIYGKAYWNEKAQWEWGVKTAAKIIERGDKYKYVYSRSMWPASHVAAYHYKKAYPNVIWYAECSDPIYMTAECEKRKSSITFEGEDSFLNDFWRDIECMVFEKADKVILNNDNQKSFMKENNELLLKWDEDKYNNKCIVTPHPVISHKWCNVIKSEYVLDQSKINIAYFGSFYDNRGIDDMFKLLKNDKVVLHIFSQQEYKIDASKCIDISRVKINAAVSQLECLNIGSKMDYLYIEENRFPGKSNPYLHSKLADYITTGTTVIARILCDDSPIEKYNNDNIVKLRNIDDRFIQNLKKKEKY